MSDSCLPPPGTASGTTRDHERIWLEPGCGGLDGRMWSPDDSWTATPDYADDGPATEYVRADLCKGTEWQPIETAPTGKELFLIGGNGRVFIVRGDILRTGRDDRTPDHLSMQWATHWMPLPEPPHD